jgi:hypothetical protein
MSNECNFLRSGRPTVKIMWFVNRRNTYSNPINSAKRRTLTLLVPCHSVGRIIAAPQCREIVVARVGHEARDAMLFQMGR